jgi:hypothetical protein
VTEMPEGSFVLKGQRKLFASTERVLNLIANDVRGGLLETVGVESSLVIDDRSSMALALPKDANTQKVAEAIDLENVESWCGGDDRVHIAIHPWYSTKDVDQTVLSATKVIHVLLGLHAESTESEISLIQKIKVSLAEIFNLQKKTG